ncbi:MAG: hypothetical protein F4X27_16545 [Chloroflexi bacterium]|nr:hypothetical protein [Chloroflexota bacterium]
MPVGCQQPEPRFLRRGGDTRTTTIKNREPNTGKKKADGPKRTKDEPPTRRNSHAPHRPPEIRRRHLPALPPEDRGPDPHAPGVPRGLQRRLEPDCVHRRRGRPDPPVRREDPPDRTRRDRRPLLRRRRDRECSPLGGLESEGATGKLRGRQESGRRESSTPKSGNGRNRVGKLAITIGVGDQQGTRFEDLEVTVDTGSTFTAVPRALLEQLGVSVTRTARARTADGRTVPVDIGWTMVRVGDQVLPTQVTFAGDGEPPRLGAVTLREALLTVDPVGQRLIPVDAERL